MKVNYELLSHIKSMMILNTMTEVIPISEIKNLDKHQEVYLILWCEESKKHKLSKNQYAKITVEEAMVYVNLGIPEYRGNAEEVEHLEVNQKYLEQIHAF